MSFFLLLQRKILYFIYHAAIEIPYYEKWSRYTFEKVMHSDYVCYPTTFFSGEKCRINALLCIINEKFLCYVSGDFRHVEVVAGFVD